MFNANSIKQLWKSSTNRLIIAVVVLLFLLSTIVPIIVYFIMDHREAKAQPVFEEELQYTKMTKAFEPAGFESEKKRKNSRFNNMYSKKPRDNQSHDKAYSRTYGGNNRRKATGEAFIKDGKVYNNVSVKDGIVYDQDGNPIGLLKDGRLINTSTGNSGGVGSSGAYTDTQSHHTDNEIVTAAPLSLYNAPSKDTSSGMPPQPGQYLPYGRWIPCILTNTIETSSHDTPIIAVTTEAVYNQGAEVLPAGCEVHGYTGGVPVRDRVISQRSWTLVWRLPGNDSGQEIKLKGVALENGATGNGKHWRYSDGKLGIKGYEVDNRDMEKLQAIALQAVSGAGAGLVSSTITTTGATSEQTFGGDWKSAAGESLNKSASLYAELLLKKVMEDGYFVICPSGTKFYLYVEETVLIKKSTRGGQPVSN